MKKLLLIPLFAILFCNISRAQNSETSKEKKWEFSADMNMYFYPGDFVGLPVIRADRNKLHLEARYNYEDMKTFSGWIGYNFRGGNEFEYFVTPMIGGVAGNSNGFAPGLEFTFGYKGFELYNESEYMFDLNSNIDNFSYTWTDFSYSITDWLWLGVSGQTTKIYMEDLLFEKGLLLGGGYKNFELTGYYYNPGSDRHFGLLTLSVSF
jgi:hypothetical protein